MTSAITQQSLRSLDTVSRLWLDPSDPWRLKAREALEVSTGYSSAQVEDVLDAVFKDLTGASLEIFVRNSRIVSDGKKQTVLHIAAGNVFTAWLHGAVITLLLGHRCWIKPSSVEPVFATLWQASLKKVDPALAEQVRVVCWSDGLPKEVDAVVAYGSDETLSRLRPWFAGKPFIGYGHKWSFGIIFSAVLAPSEWPAWRERLQRDVAAFQLQGCLSPQRIFVQGGRALDLPASWPSSCSPRIESFKTLEDIRGLLGERLEHVSCIGVAGLLPSQLLATTRCFGDKKGIRYCAIGEMQRPELTWRNGGISLMEELQFQFRKDAVL